MKRSAMKKFALVGAMSLTPIPLRHPLAWTGLPGAAALCPATTATAEPDAALMMSLLSIGFLLCAKAGTAGLAASIPYRRKT